MLMPKKQHQHDDDQTTGAPIAWPILMSDRTLGLYLDLSRTTIWKLVSTKKLPEPVRVPGIAATRWNRADVDRVVAEWGTD